MILGGSIMSTNLLPIVLVLALLACCILPMLFMRKRDRSSRNAGDEGVGPKPRSEPPPK